jgi:hypothetical protein
LPPDLQEEARVFIESLLERKAPRRNGEPRLDWRGALRDLRDKYTSVELQHTAVESWGGLMYLLDTSIFLD